MNVNRVNPIGFGKLVKIDAPRHIVESLRDRINAGGSKKLDRDLKAIFDDLDKGEARTYFSSRYGFISTGEETALTERKIKSANDLDRAAEGIKTDSRKVNHFYEIWLQHNEEWAKMFNSIETLPTLDVKYSKITNRIKSVNLIA